VLRVEGPEALLEYVVTGGFAENFVLMGCPVLAERAVPKGDMTKSIWDEISPSQSHVTQRQKKVSVNDMAPEMTQPSLLS